jgi:hypothetical protein
METILKKICQYRIQWEMKKMDTPVPDLNKAIINVTKEHSDTTYKPSKEKFWKISLRNLWRRY